MGRSFRATRTPVTKTGSGASRKALHQPSLHRAVCEALEERQLMSLTIEVRNSNGTSTGTVSTLGQTLSLEVIAVISSTSNDPTEDGLQDIQGSFISSAQGQHSVAGNLAAANIAPFRASGSFPGTVQDLNGDGNLDVGSNNAADTQDYFFARAGALETSDVGTIVGNTLTFEIATLTYTVTSLKEGGSTSINFVPFVNPGGLTADWAENGVAVNSADGTFQAGTAYTVSDPTLIVPPTAVNDTATVALNTATDIHELSNDTVVEPLNLASVTVTSAASHGTTQLQSDGSILYTPVHGYTGADSFAYTVADTGGRVSNAATVSITVVPTPAPVAGYVSSTTYLDQPVTINVLSHDSSVATLVPSSVTVVGAPVHGTAVAQSNGTIIYTPSTGYLGTDGFTYTVSDSNGETSSASTVAITVSQPVLPTANNDTYNIIAGTPTSLDVMANDVEGSITSNTTVHIASQPADGTAVVQSNQTVLYTPNADYTGTDSFTYVLLDALDEASSPATVSLTIGAATAPVAGPVTAPVLSGKAGSINVLASVTSQAPIEPSSVAIATEPADGTATVNSDGTVSYTPLAGFIGTDTFTYTATTTNGVTTSPGTVSVNVGTTISNAKGATHSIHFKDAAGGIETISLNAGSAQIYFAGNGSLTVARNGAGTVTGTGLNLGSITLTGTSKASALSIKGSTKAPVTLGAITDSSPLGSLSAASVNVTGNITLNSVASLTLGNITNATITIGSGSPGRFALTSGAVSNSSLGSAVPITTLRSASWSGSESITAPSIGNLIITTGGLASNVSTGALASLSVGGNLTGNITATAIKSARVTGAISGSTINLTGSGTDLASLTAGSITSSSILAGVTSRTSFIDPATTPTGNIGTIHVTSRSGDDFTDGAIVANKITSVSVGEVMTDNSANPDNTGSNTFGIDATTLGSFTGIFSAGILHLSRAQLQNEEILQAYLQQQGTQFGDFAIQL